MIVAQQTTRDYLQQLFHDYVLKAHLPTRAEYVDGLASLGPLQAVGLLLAGAAFLVYGFKYFKAFIIIDGAVIGALVGGYIGTLSRGGNLPLLLGMAGAIVLIVLAWKALKYAVGILGAAAGGLLGYGVWYVIAVSLDNAGMLRHAWAGALIGAVAVGLLTFIVFRQAVMILTALQGSLMMVSGVCSILLLYELAPALRDELISNRYLLCLMIAVPAMAGFVLQFATESGKIRKDRKTTEKPPV